MLAGHFTLETGAEQWDQHQEIAAVDGRLLDHSRLLGSHVQAQVAAAQDDGIGRPGDAVKVAQRLHVLHLHGIHKLSPLCSCGEYTYAVYVLSKPCGACLHEQ